MPSITLPHLLPPYPHFTTAFNTDPYILYLHKCYVLQYCWCSVIPFSFLSLPEFHSVVPLSQTCSTCVFVNDHICFCVYVYLLDLSSAYERKRASFLSEPDLLHLTWCAPIAFIYLQTTWYHSSLWLSKTPSYTSYTYIYVTFSWFFSCRASGLFPQFSYCEQCGSKHGCASVSIASWLTFLWIYAQDQNYWITWQFCF
jgi:hypothetical protein